MRLLQSIGSNLNFHEDGTERLQPDGVKPDPERDHSRSVGLKQHKKQTKPKPDAAPRDLARPVYETSKRSLAPTRQNMVLSEGTATGSDQSKGWSFLSNQQKQKTTWVQAPHPDQCGLKWTGPDRTGTIRTSLLTTPSTFSLHFNVKNKTYIMKMFTTTSVRGTERRSSTACTETEPKVEF